MHDGLFLLLLVFFLAGWGVYMHNLDSNPPEGAEVFPKTTIA